MKKICLVILSVILLLSSCKNEQKLVRNPDRIADIQRMLAEQKQLTAKSLLPVWDFLNQPLASDEMQAMEFLYAYMPLSDLADYSNDFFLKNVQFSLKARAEMPWGKTIPEQEFLHFVLPLRVNNENLDNFREVMYHEIKERIKGLGMKESVLEINHWCHEKVDYRGTDSRTSSPLSTVKKSFGRCGEESTFVVTALRTAGIPARQVYTPRWAHTDDNHAWVEVWVDGKWQHIGACEPEPDFNVGWYIEPSTRVMLVHTRVYGHYFGNEMVLNTEDRFTELNLTAHYAPVKQVTVVVKNSDGSPADSAAVEFQLYNYAEFYPLTRQMTNKEGIAVFSTGMGDLVIRAAKNGRFAFGKLSVDDTDSLTLALGQEIPAGHAESFDLIPPMVGNTESAVTDDERKENDRRFAEEDSIRNSYMSTFKDSLWVAGFVAKNNLPFDTVLRFIKLSYGNWEQIALYLEKNSADFRSTLLKMAGQIADKDFSDTPESILTDHLVHSSQTAPYDMISSDEIFVKYVLNPRIALEILSPWRGFLKSSVGEEMARTAQTDIQVLTKWINDNITVDHVANKHSRAPLTPGGVYNLRVADPLSRDIFFVAACRSFGIPARLNPETRFPEYYKSGEWLRAGFDSSIESATETGFLKLVDTNNLIIPRYYTHFTIGALRDGFYRSLEFNEGEILTDKNAPLILETGDYALVTGNRLDNGGVLSQMVFFTIKNGELTTVPLELRRQQVDLKPMGKLNLEGVLLTKADGKTVDLSLEADEKFTVLVLLEPEKEPSRHILNDLAAYADDFNRQSVRFIFVLPVAREAHKDVLKTYHLPLKAEIRTDTDDKIIKSITSVYGKSFENKFPLVLVCDDTGNVYMFSSGYKIGVGEQIHRITQNNY
jgi:transglutaminase-like putative cysteine protease